MASFSCGLTSTTPKYLISKGDASGPVSEILQAHPFWSFENKAF